MMETVAARLRAIRPRSAMAWFPRFRRGRSWRVAAVVLAALGGGWLGLALGGHVTTPIGPADVRISVSPAWHGATVLNVPPLGDLSFETHQSPLRIDVSVAKIRLAAAEELFNDPTALQRLAGVITEDVRAAVISLFVRSAVAAVLGAAVVALVIFRDLRRAGWSALTALLTLMAAGGVTAATFNPGAISEPRYTGLLAGAPQLVGSTEDVVNRFSQYREQLAGLVGNVSKLYEVTSALPVYEGDDSTVRVLHVSDIHLNPAAWNVIRQLTEQFQIDVIVDSGDLTDRGSAPEDAFADTISTFDMPYIWVRGNHDSMGTQRAVADQENAVVLDGDTAEVEGITFYGAGDPRFAPDKVRDNPNAEEVTAIGVRQAESIADADPPVDVAVLHDPLQGEGFSGYVPLVLSGHGHDRWTELRPTGTRFFVQGSTGGAGLRGLSDDADSPTPYQASVLYFDRETDRLRAWDNITLGGLGLSSARIERHVEEDPQRDIDPEARGTPVPTASGSPPPSSREPSPTASERQ